MLKTTRRYINSLAALFVVLLTLTVPPRALADGAVRLFILSGQSNMSGLDPNLSFTPAVNEAFADDEVIVVKNAHSGQPIRRWYRQWKPEGADEISAGNGDLYNQLMNRVTAAIGDRQPDTITFVWMQGESDAYGHGAVYAESMRGLIEQLRTDMERDDIDVVIGRISDYSSEQFPDWELVRTAEVDVAEADERAAWVDTDDLNGNNGLHYTGEGYVELGSRFATAAIALIEKAQEQ